MILFLTLVLLFLMITIGGERGAVSIMALAGNIIILFFSVILMSDGKLFHSSQPNRNQLQSLPESCC